MPICLTREPHLLEELSNSKHALAWSRLSFHLGKVQSCGQTQRYFEVAWGNLLGLLLRKAKEAIILLRETTWAWVSFTAILPFLKLWRVKSFNQSLVKLIGSSV